MKNLKKKIFGAFLSAVMLTSMLPFAVSADASQTPATWNLVWENDFDDATTSTSATATNYSAEQSDIDFRAEYCYYEIKEKETDATDKYFYAYPRKLGSATVIGNRFSAGYFTNDNLADFPLDNIKIDISLKLDNLFDMTLTSYAPNSSNFATVLKFDANGNIVFADKNVDTYTAGSWVDLSLVIDYNTDTVELFKGEESLGSSKNIYRISEQDSFRNLMVRISPSSSSTQPNTYYGVAIDNLKYYTTHSDNYINHRPNIDSCTYDFVDLDFTGLTANTGISTTADYTVSGTAKVKTENGNEYIAFEDDATLIVSEANTRDCYSYVAFGKYSDAVKIEFDVKRTAKWTAFVKFGDKEFIRLLDNNIQFHNGAAYATGASRNYNEWATVSIYMDFANGKYWSYVDGEFAGNYNIPAGISTPENLTFWKNKLCVDNITISTLPPYGDNAIVEYTDAKYQTKIGYVVNNTGSEVKTYDIYCAKFSAAGFLESVTITQGTVAAGAMELEELTTQRATDGGYYEYFVWEQNTLIPLVKKLSVK